MYEGPSVAFKPQGPKRPRSGSEYSGKLPPSLPPPLSEIVFICLCTVYCDTLVADLLAYISICSIHDS